jgi:hypothetical protein
MTMYAPLVIVTTTPGDKFKVSGLPTLYDDVLDALARARKRANGVPRRGTRVTRISDGKVLATFQMYVPSSPRSS